MRTIDFFKIIFFIFFINCNAQQNLHLIKAPSVTYKNKLNADIRNNWQHLDIEKDTIPGTSLNRAYAEILKKKKGKEIIVAVMDNYMDINHEDLKAAIWTNKKEIPNNGIDDDHNGYIDDIHGWNFLGGKNEKDLEYANSESTRILRVLQKKYGNPPNFIKNIKDSLLYVKAINRYKEDKDFLIELQKSNSENITQYKRSEVLLRGAYNKIDFKLGEFDSLYWKANSDELKKAIWFVRNIHRLGKNLDVLKVDSLKIVEELKYTYDETFYDRDILGDNELDLKDNHYGSNNMWSKSKKHYHGTIVAGVLGANRSNNLGIKGFSDQIKIMPIKTTPNGGSENDKDVALGIRYAVDNGARIINMSFGKTSSLHPEWIKEALKYAESHDVLVIAGAGNNSWDNDAHPFYPIDYDEASQMEYCNNFIKVGATTLDGNKFILLPSTNYGKKSVDIFAPGYFLRTTDPNIGYSYRDGTSMASPIVSGVAAIIRSYYPKLKASEVKQIILESGVSYDSLQVQVPGEKQGTLKPFKDLSKTGKIVNVYNALLTAKKFSKAKNNN